MSSMLLAPPLALLVVLAATLILARVFARLETPAAPGAPAGSRKAYACGENVERPRLQPDYAEFFPFAFFFTMLHVVTLIVATMQTSAHEAILVAGVYVAGALVGLSILFRKGTEDEPAAEDTDLGED
jgi:NADH-quinone oxidoreductase subunit A